MLFLATMALSSATLNASLSTDPEAVGSHTRGARNSIGANHPQGASFRNLDEIIEQAVSSATIPGAVLVIGHNGRVVYRKAYGSRSLEPAREAMTVDTVFDLASLTKCIATTTSIMQLWQQGKVRLNDPVSAYLPEFAQNGKQDVTVRELLTHYSGLRPDLDLTPPWKSRESAYQMAMQEKPANPPGAQFVYSDINFETLGFIVEKLSGQTLSDYATRHIFDPLRMRHTRYLPPSEWRPRIAPTEYDESGQMLRGIVHDPTARRMGGVAGHAGLFSTADDLALFAQDLLDGHRVLSAETVEKMSTPQQPANASSLRGLGWDIDSPFASNRGELLPVGSFGHTGFTGTSLWIDPVTRTYVILLTNAVHPHVGKSVVSLRTRVSTAAVEALHLSASEAGRMRQLRITGYNESMMAARRIVSRNGEVQAGIDVLEKSDFAAVRALKRKSDGPIRIGLVTNQTAVDRRELRTADVLASAPGLQLKAIFSPEHGVAGKLDTALIGNSKDEATNVPVFSVYGESDASRRPSEDQLRDIDILVYDIQDIGVRFYTYESTLGYFLEAAARFHKPLIVLDRPNPIGGAFVQGPVADAGREGFTSYSQSPIRHGMTVGELASMWNSERNLHADLKVVRMEGWLRGDWFDSTGLAWINPSPNMRSLTAATLYPGIGMIETTNISVGRGTDTPFEIVGAPWIKPDSEQPAVLARELNGRLIEGVRFVPVTFTPNASNYANLRCGGVNILVTDRNALDGPELGLEIAATLHRLYPTAFQLDSLDALMRSKVSAAAVDAGSDPRRIAAGWADDIQKFEAVRTRYLLY